MAEPLQPPDSEMPRRKLSFSDSDGLSTSTSAAPERMQAFVRLRPLSGKEARATIATTETDCTISLNKPSAQGYGTIEEHSFSFDGVFGPDASQPEVYEAVMRPQVQALLEGRDTLTFAYGITNAGKTYTVQGGAAPEQRGVLPRALCSIFGALDALRAGGEAAAGSRLDPSCSYKVAASFLEIYGAEAHDLLAPAEKAGSWWQGIRGRGPVPLRIKEGGGKVSVDGLKEAVWADLAEALAAVEYGWANRQSASNGVNDVSSRSHAVLSIKLLVTPTGESKPKVTRLTVVDLAGAEEQTQGTQRVPPYSNSRITMLFRDFLSGSGQTVVIAALNPRAIDA
ncbi:hypothetical protein EMIHUDRAFT_414777, partial [Emiliania huxleyi CCMP1516]|uniref:Kinesin motor domain-containing protein n=4 Tax=Emiliania huxleyi TaxID=2903 RepID=A0A0D3I795_EMIH1